MPLYTFLVQVLPKGGRGWASMREAHTGAPAEGTIGIVDVLEGALPNAAQELIEPFLSVGLRCRVSFWEGRKVNDNLYASEVFLRVYDDGTIDDAATVRQGLREDPMKESKKVCQGCPHIPHGGACGHKGSCVVAHPSMPCEAVRPICPACFEEERASVVPGIVSRVERDGVVVLRCSSCERLSFQFDDELVCGVCQWLVPHVNEELEDRFAANSGDFGPSPDACTGCGQQISPPMGPFTYGCPRCGHSVVLNVDSFSPGRSISTMCPNKKCGKYIKIPRNIWCQECGQGLRSLKVIARLTQDANDLTLVIQNNVREDDVTRLARRLATAAESSVRKYDYLSDEQRSLFHNRRHIDSLVFSIDAPEEWIRDVVEIRAAGHELHSQGGMPAMLETHQRVLELGLKYRNAARHIEVYWNGIGDWLG